MAQNSDGNLFIIFLHKKTNRILAICLLARSISLIHFRFCLFVVSTPAEFNLLI